MKTIAEIMENDFQQNALLSLVNREIRNDYNPSSKYIELRRWMYSLPSEITEAIKRISAFQGIDREEKITQKGKLTLFYKKTEEFEFMFEIQDNYKKGIVRAWYTLYDNTNRICAHRDLLKTDVLNTL